MVLATCWRNPGVSTNFRKRQQAFSITLGCAGRTERGMATIFVDGLGESMCKSERLIHFLVAELI